MRLASAAVAPYTGASRAAGNPKWRVELRWRRRPMPWHAVISSPAHRCIVLCGALAWVVACHVAEHRAAGRRVLHPFIDSIEDVASLDVTAQGTRIHALLSGKPKSEATSVVVYTDSSDGGSTWRTPIELSQTDDPPALSGHGNDVQLAVDGEHLVAVWQVEGPLPGTGPMVVAYSRDGGATWVRGANPAVGDLTHNQSYMDLATDRTGYFHLVWLDDRNENGNSQGLRYARSSDQGQTWQMETTLDESACTCCWNRVATVPGRGVVVLYRDQEPHDMRLSHSENAGQSWQPSGAVGNFDWHFSGCPHCGGALTVAAHGDRPTLHSLVWTGKPDAAGLYFLSSSDQGRSWSPPQSIGTSRSRRADIAAWGDELAAVFTDSSPQNNTISLIHSANGGKTWSSPKLLTRLASASGQPRILATPSGFQAFWTEKDNAGRDVFAATHLN